MMAVVSLAWTVIHLADPEEVLGVRRDGLGLDGFHGPVPAGYGGRDPVFGAYEAPHRA